MKKIKLNDFLKNVLEFEEKTEMNKFDFHRILTKLYINTSSSDIRFYLLFSFNCLYKEENIHTFAATFENNFPTLIIPKNPEVWNALIQSEADFIFILKHEILHLISLHPFRMVKLMKEYRLNNEILNIIMDGLINNQISTNSLKALKNIIVDLNFVSQLTQIPKEELIKMTIEEIIEKLKNFQNNQNQNSQNNNQNSQNNNQNQNNQTGQGDGQSQDSLDSNNSEGNQNSKDLKKEFAKDIKTPNNSTEEGSRPVIKEMIENISKTIGKTPAEIEEIIQRWKKITNILIDFSGVFSKLREIDRTFSYPSQINISNPKFPYILPAYKKLQKPSVLLIIDTSGSIEKEEFELFFGVMKKISEKAEVDYLEIDTEIKNKSPESFNNTIKTIKFKGRGGTDFIDLERLKNFNKKDYNIVIILTDGYVNDFPKFNPLPKAKWFLFYTENKPPAPKFIELYHIKKVIKE